MQDGKVDERCHPLPSVQHRLTKRAGTLPQKGVCRSGRSFWGLLPAGEKVLSRARGNCFRYELLFANCSDEEWTTARYPLGGRLRDLNRSSGGEESRTPDLFNAIEALYQLSYTPLI